MTDSVPTTTRRAAGVGRVLIVAWFFAVISVPLAAFALGVRPAPVENRALAPQPDVRPGRLFDTALYTEIADWYEDRLPGRDHAVEADAWIDYRVFGDSPNPRVSLGADGWLFLTDAVRATCITPQRAAEISAEADLLARTARAAGLEVILLVAPNKAAIYPDRLGDLAPEARCATSNREMVQAALEGSPVFVDTWQVLETSREATDVLLYHRTDTHWTRFGASVAAAELVEQVAPGLWDPGALVHGGTQRRHGDLVALMGLSFREEAAAYRVWRGTGPEVARVSAGGGPQVVVSEMNGVPVVGGRSILVHDSMGEVLVPLLRPYFEHLTSVRNRSASSFGIAGGWFAGMMADADYLVLQTVERELVDRFNGSVARDVIAALAGRLPHVEVPVDGPGPYTVDLPEVPATRFLVTVRGGDAGVHAGGFAVSGGANGAGTAVLDVSGMAGAVVLTTEAPPSGVLLVTLP
jgi:hypothetical protein